MSFDFSLPLRQPDSPTETIIFLVEWGDGQSEVMTLEGGNNWNPAIYTHSYATDEAKTIKIYPLIGETFGKYWNFGDQTADRLKLTNISAWGSFQFDRSGGAFEGCSNLSFSSAGGAPSFGPAGDPPNSPNNALARAFKGCSSLSPNANALAGWGPSLVNVNSLSETFSGCLNLNLNLDNWSVSNVRTTYRMFYNCPSINQSFAGWTNVSNLENMSEMFSGATNFAGEIFANWDSTSFSDGSNKTSSDISGMFKGTKFNGANVSTWDVSNISNFSSVFEGATLFTDQLGGLHDWDTGEGTNFYNMFNGATSFNRDISQWDTSKGTNFNSMFEGATIFNQNINTGAEINKHGGLYNPWTIRSDVAVTMDNMLTGASAFDQDISDWDVTNISSATNLLTGTNLSVANALEINDSSTGWPSQGGASAAVTNESAAAVQASGTAPAITSHSAQGSTYTYANPENTQTTVNLVATGAPVPTLSLANNSAAIDKDKFTLVDNGDGTGTLKLTNAPNFESPTDDAWAGQNTYAVYVHATNAVGSANAFFNFNVTDVADVAAPAVSNAGIPAGNEPSPIWAYFGWTSAGEGVKYKYQLASDAGFTSLLKDHFSGHIPTYITTSSMGVTLSPETTYYFRVRATQEGSPAYEVDGPWTTWSIVTADATFAPTWVDRGSGSTAHWAGNSTYYDNDENTIETVSFEAAGTPTPSFSIKTGTGEYDGDMFTVVDNGDGTGLIKLTNPIDYENRPWNYAYGKNHYSAIVVAENTHNGNNTTIETIFTVFPKNVSDVVAPAVTSQPTTNLTPTSFFINWSSVGSGVRYTYEFASDSGFNSILRQDNDYGGIYVTTSGAGLTLTPETTYYFRVKANGGGVGSTYEVDGPWTTWSIDTAAFHSAHLIGVGHGTSLFRKSDDSLWGVGRNDFGQLGDGTTTDRSSPVQISSSSGTQFSGGKHTVFQKTSFSLWAMGRNTYGQLGDGSTSHRSSPVEIVSSGVISMAAGYEHTIFSKSDGSLWAMGYNYSGQLGDGTTTNRSSPVQILASGVTQVFGGEKHSFFRKDDGSLWGMGANHYGQLGVAGGGTQTSPVQIFSSGIQGVVCGRNHSFFRKNDGSLWAAGWNNYGQLGDGTTTDRSSPVEIFSQGYFGVAAGAHHSLFRKNDGSLHAVGLNNSGQLGDGTTATRTSPVQILASGVTEVSAHWDHSFFQKDDDSIWSMGYGGWGVLGDGTTTSRSSPVQM